MPKKQVILKLTADERDELSKVALNFYKVSLPLFVSVERLINLAYDMGKKER
jgi:hypothetical protein